MGPGTLNGTAEGKDQRIGNEESSREVLGSRRSPRKETRI